METHEYTEFKKNFLVEMKSLFPVAKRKGKNPHYTEYTKDEARILLADILSALNSSKDGQFNIIKEAVHISGIDKLPTVTTVKNFDAGTANTDFYWAFYFWLHINQPQLEQLRHLDRLLINGRPLKKIISPPFTPPIFVSEDNAFHKGANIPEAYVSIWLNPLNHHALPFYGREREMKFLEQFEQAERRFLIAAVIGPSGAGKTRLVSEWIKKLLENEGWHGGFIQSRDTKPWEDWHPTAPTALIIDYTYHYDEVIDLLKRHFQNHKSHKIRVLLVDHVLPENTSKNYILNKIQPSIREAQLMDQEDSVFFDPFYITLEPEKDKSFLLRQIAAAAADPYTPASEKRYTADDPIIIKAIDALEKLAPLNTDENQDENQVRSAHAARHPLFAALIGQAIYKDENTDFSNLSRRDLIQQYFSESHRLPWEENPDDQNILGGWIGYYVSAATLLGQANFRTLYQHIPEVMRHGELAGKRQEIEDRSKQIVSGDHSLFLKPFEPDILGETFFLKFLDSHEQDHPDIMSALYSLLSSIDDFEMISGFLETIQRLTRNLINDDQTLSDVQAAWGHLSYFLNPEKFQANSPMRQAVSIALADIVQQFYKAGFTQPLPDFNKQIIWEDLIEALHGLFAFKRVEPSLWACEYNLQNPSLLINPAQIQETLKYIVGKFHARLQHGLSVTMLCAYFGTVECFKFISELPTEDLNQQNNDGITALMIAAFRNHPAFIQFLLDAGVDVNLRDTAGWTALMLACDEGHEKIVQILTNQEIEINQKNDCNMTALMLACQAGHEKIVQILTNQEIEIDQQNYKSMPALMLASKAGHEKIVKLLLSANADLDKHNDFGMTTLMLASEAGHEKVVKLLLSAKVDVNKQDLFGATALIFACRAGHEKVVKLLLSAKVDVNKQDFLGATALMFAAENGNIPVFTQIIPHVKNKLPFKSYRDHLTKELDANIKKVVSYGWGANIIEYDNQEKERVFQRILDAGYFTLFDKAILLDETFLGLDFYENIILVEYVVSRYEVVTLETISKISFLISDDKCLFLNGNVTKPDYFNYREIPKITEENTLFYLKFYYNFICSSTNDIFSVLRAKNEIMFHKPWPSNQSKLNKTLNKITVPFVRKKQSSYHFMNFEQDYFEVEAFGQRGGNLVKANFKVSMTDSPKAICVTFSNDTQLTKKPLPVYQAYMVKGCKIWRLPPLT